jgi:hypothetical protein
VGFAVTGPVGTKDAKFEAYARLLRQHGKALGNLPRVPDPQNPKRRWAYAWNTQEEAQQFADELKEQTEDTNWHVEATDAPASNGPFGPILILLSLRSDGLVLALHLLSLAMIREAFADASPAASNAFVNTQTWHDFRKTRGNLSALAREIVPSLTGLSMDRLTDLGYAVIDTDTDRTWVYVPPVDVANSQV